jgi:hypothetical protein
MRTELTSLKEKLVYQNLGGEELGGVMLPISLWFWDVQSFLRHRLGESETPPLRGKLSLCCFDVHTC